MNLQSLLIQLEELRIKAEERLLDPDIVMLSAIDFLAGYINNVKVSDKIDEIPF